MQKKQWRLQRRHHNRRRGLQQGQQAYRSTPKLINNDGIYRNILNTYARTHTGAQLPIHTDK